MNNNLLLGLNKQINKEIFSSYLYFAMSVYFTDINMEGFAKVIKNQAKEELEHAKKINNYLIARNEKINFFTIEAPETNWINPMDAIKSALNHEKIVTDSINNLFQIARDEKDYATEVFLHWFIAEQIEEEEKFRTLLEKIENAENCDCEIIHIDRTLELDKEYVE